MSDWKAGRYRGLVRYPDGPERVSVLYELPIVGEPVNGHDVGDGWIAVEVNFGTGHDYEYVVKVGRLLAG